MIIIERFERGSTPHYRPSPPTPVISIDTCVYRKPRPF
jgi:hypothetical protein